LLVGQWDTLTQQGGDNVKLYGVFKNANSLLVVGKHTGTGNAMPVSNVPAWGNATFNGESAVLARFTAANIVDPDDSPVTTPTAIEQAKRVVNWIVAPNPTTDRFTVRTTATNVVSVALIDNTGRTLRTVNMSQGVAEFDDHGIASGTYLLVGRTSEGMTTSFGKVVLR
jgi:hypothetical protein